MKRKRLMVGAGLLALLLIVGGIVIWQGGRETATPAPTSVAPSDAANTPEQPRVTNPSTTANSGDPNTSASATATTTGSTGSTSSRAGTVPGECMTTLTEIEATTFAIDQMGVKVPMMSLGEDESGAAAAPPKNASHAVGWWKNGPKVGSRQGHAILTIHTYQNGKALGNELYHSTNGFEVGDLVRMTDKNGNTQCYTLEKSLKVWVKDYDPNSEVLYKFDGEPRAVIVICWDYNLLNKAWDSRILYYLKPVASAA
ncbi:class F sortase [Aestuariimicrobium sp. Y1814]|uniref:class F sortase n=1 Tax=Aestuariimicrobium sp. Y1814 TaxID=3418742 RepID=UPI003DA6F39E